jgi:hypothetical protein
MIAFLEGDGIMPAVTVQARISPDLKKQADALFAALGLSTAEDSVFNPRKNSSPIGIADLWRC